MSGHSKWSTIKRKKEKTDNARAKVFTKIGREIAIAVREGGPDPASNSKLKDCIAKAKANNVPNDNIDRIIKKASGDGNSANYEEIVYEGYGPSGIAVIVETLTDNRNRTAGEMRHYFDKNKGNMGQSGCVSFLFNRQGEIVIEAEDIDEEKLMEDALEAGAADFITDEDVYIVRTEPNDLGAVRDDLEAKGYKFVSAEVEYIPTTTTRLESEDDLKMMSRLLGARMIPLTAYNGHGVKEVLEATMETIEESEKETKHHNVNYGPLIEDCLKELGAMCPELDRYTVLKIIENDQHAVELVSSQDNADLVKKTATDMRQRIERDFNDDIVSIITDLKYGFVRGALAEALTPNPDRATGETKPGYSFDRLLTNRWLALPILLVLMWLMFEATFTLGAYPQEWIENGIGWLGQWIGKALPDGILRDLIVDGIIGGVGGVLVFLPQILILFFFISLLEDSGYMARAAFIVDRIMHRVGLHGKSFIPYLIGFGCGVPAIMATRTLENRRDRLVTILTVPFMSCSARLPAYLLLVAAFFTAKQGLILMSIYLIGILVAAITAIIMSKTFLKHDKTQFVMELPPYRKPTARNATIHMWSKGKQYLQKMATIILAASIIVWALGYFPRHEGQTPQEQIENSYMGQMGKAIEPVVAPLGFNWQMGVSVLTGAAAKEIVVSTMGVLYTGEADATEESASLKEKLQTATKPNGEHVFDPIVAYSFMLFILLYFPCIAALAAIKREAGTKWMIFEIFYTTGVAWLISFIFYQVARMF